MGLTGVAHGTRTAAEALEVLRAADIGGTFSAECARFFPGVAVVNDRSLSALSLCAVHMQLRPIAAAPGWLPALLRGAMVAVVRYVACWEIEPLEEWRRLPAGRKLAVFHAEDEVIPHEAQLVVGLNARGCTRAEVGCVLELANVGFERDERAQLQGGHNRDYSRVETKRLRAAFDALLAGRALPETL